MEKIIFEPVHHAYTRVSDGLPLMSVSHFRKQFEKVNWEHNIRKAALQRYLGESSYKKKKDAWEDAGGHVLDPNFILTVLKRLDKKTFLRICEEVREEWKSNGLKRAALGTEKHAAKEAEASDMGYSVNPVNGLEYPTQPHGKKEDGSNETIVERLSDLEPGFYSELIVWYFFPDPVFSESMGKVICGVAGTLDKGYVEPAKIMIGDYKFTEKKLSDFGIKYKNFGKEMHSDPWSDWVITKISGYRIQLNTYGYMAQQLGLEPVDLRLHNHTDDGEEHTIILPYEGFRVSQALERTFMDGL